MAAPGTKEANELAPEGKWQVDSDAVITHLAPTLRLLGQCMQLCGYSGGETGRVRPRRQLRSEKARARAARRHLACCVTMEGDTGLMKVTQGRARGSDCLLRSRLLIHRKEAISSTQEPCFTCELLRPAGRTLGFLLSNLPTSAQAEA